jgi:ABC-type glycerol-3-phosphate transport system substrate-binding protein
MKKTLTALIAAGALLGAAGCSAPQDTTEKSCARIQTVGAGPTSAADKAGMIRLANRLRPIEATASGELQAPLNSIIEFFDASA